MITRFSAFSFIATLMLALSGAGSLAGAAQNGPGCHVGGYRQGFDYYLLSYSWSPEWCDFKGNDIGSPQCTVGSGNGFVVHGLWPQISSSSSVADQPCNCPEPFGRSTAADKAAATGVLAEADLLDHEYEKHGSCANLSPADYVKKIKVLKDSITIPDTFARARSAFSIAPAELVAAFARANPALRRNSIVVSCAARKLVEVRICISKDGTPQDCPADVLDQSCKARSIKVLPMR